jgi:glycosyltransferase involved in cell wall biosynthesis
MKVVLVSNGPFTTAERDPLVRRQVPLLRRLEAQGVSIVVALLGDGGGLRAYLEDAGIRVDLLPTPLPPSPASLGRLPAAVLGLRSVLRRHDADILEGDEPLPAIAVGLAARGVRRPVVVYRRHHSVGRARLVVASRVAAHLADRTIVSCEAMRRCAAEQDRISLERIDIASSGAAELDVPAPADVDATRRSLGIVPVAHVIGVVSRLRWEKGLDVLIESLDLIGDIGEVHAIVAGVGPEESGLRQLAARSRIPVHFVGHRPDVARWLAVADVIVMPSRRESFGRVTLETMAAGRPLVASRVGGLTDAVADRETGLLVPPENPAALAAALRSILIDPAGARRMGEAARRRYEACYTIDHMATSWRVAWEAAVAAARTPS